MDSLSRTYKRLIEMLGGYDTRDRPRSDPRGGGVALINTAGRGRGDQGQGARGNGVGPETKGNMATKKRKTRTRKMRTSKRGDSPTPAQKGIQAVGTAAARSTGSTSVPSSPRKTEQSYDTMGDQAC